MSAAPPQGGSSGFNVPLALAEEQSRLAKIWDAVNHDQPNENLDLLIDECLKEPDIRTGIERTKLDIDFVRAAIKSDRTKVWEVATGELADLKSADDTALAARKRRDSLLDSKPLPLGPVGESQLGEFLQGAGGLGLLGGIVAAVVVLYRNGLRVGLGLLGVRYLNYTMAVVFLTGVGFASSYWLKRIRSARHAIKVKEREQEIDGWENKSEVTEATRALTDAEKQLEQRKAAVVRGVLEKALNNRFRQLINQQTVPSYETRLKFTSARGLAEVFDPKSAIDTSARNKLQFMLENMPGGSIGIAGPRGAGKTTLLRSFCGPRRTLTKLKEKEVLAVLVSAPVAYQPRDFILYLFSTVCQTALKAQGEDNPRPALEQAQEVATPSVAFLINLLGPLPSLCIYLGTALSILALLLGLFLTFFPAPRNEKEELAKPASASAPADSKPTATPEAQPSQPGAQPSPSAAPAPSPVKSLPAYLADFIRAMEISPGALLLWGIILIGFGMISAAIIGEKPLRTLGLSWLRMLRLIPPMNVVLADIFKLEVSAETVNLAAGEKNETPSPTPRTLKSEARDWLKRIKFQQSYTSGWSGSLKLPVGLEGNVNNAVTLAENQLSLPEISSAFTDFVELASQDYQVIIGIDELDKLEADKGAAHLFLNDIKSVFGLEKCFYLISVSENAMSSFERRGLPFRDVFDSSFDDIIYVDYLNFESAQNLLEKKVIGRPLPFFGLSYSLSAGLARDLIRNFRALVEFHHGAPNSNDLETVCRAIVHADLKAKVRATAVSVKELELERDADAFLEKLYKLENVLSDPAALFTASIEMLKASVPVQEAEPDKEQEARCEKLLDLAEELATYVFFAVSVLEFFNNSLSQEALTKPGVGGTLDELARARQLLAMNPNATRSIVSAFRQAHNLPFRTWPAEMSTSKNGRRKPRASKAKGSN